MEIIRGLFAYLGMMMWIIWIGTEDIMDWILGKLTTLSMLCIPKVCAVPANLPTKSGK